MFRSKHCKLINSFVGEISTRFDTEFTSSSIASLERTPPVPTLQGGENSLHRFLGLRKERHILSMSLRDPFDGRELPPNGNKFVNAHCIRGVRKVRSRAHAS